MNSNNNNINILNKLVMVCKNGKLTTMQKILKQNQNFNITWSNNYIFQTACINNHVHIAKWLLEYKPEIIDSDCFNEQFTIACYKGHTELAKLLYLHKPNIIYANDYDAFISACENGNITIARWLYKKNENIFDFININKLFENVCSMKNFIYWPKTKLRVAKWLLHINLNINSVGNIVTLNTNNIIISACKYNNIELLEFIKSINPFKYGDVTCSSYNNIKSDEESTFNALMYMFDKKGLLNKIPADCVLYIQEYIC